MAQQWVRQRWEMPLELELAQQWVMPLELELAPDTKKGIHSSTLPDPNSPPSAKMFPSTVTL